LQAALTSLLDKGETYESSAFLTDFCESDTYNFSDTPVDRFKTAPDDFSPYLDMSPDSQERLSSPKDWLNDECINSITALIHYRLLDSNQRSNASDCAVFSSVIFTLMTTDATDERLWRNARRSRYWKCRTWLFPIHYLNHWVVAMVLVREGVVYLYDSFGSEHGTFDAKVLQVLTLSIS
jgi:hypothetical protein